MSLLYFFRDGIASMLRGGKLYWSWILFLLALIAYGGWMYVGQLADGLVTTGMSDQVSWGLYIANFAFLVGVAASAVMLVIPAYIFERKDLKEVVLLGEGMAVAAVVTAMLFVVIDLGRPDRFWHIIPFFGKFNFPVSLLAWDVVVLSGYLLLNLLIPFYILFKHYRGEEPTFRAYFPWVLVAIAWAISIHTVTAFLFSANSARPFWHTALLGPRFIASAFVSGPALIIIAFQLIGRFTGYPVQRRVIDLLALIMTVSLQISLFFVGVELFTDFYNKGAHAASIHYLFFGMRGADSLRPWIWAALAFNITAVIILTVHPWRRNLILLNIGCMLCIVGIWIEKGMGLVVPGFIPTPLGEIFEYSPTYSEIIISIACWAVGILIFTVLTKATVPIELGQVRAPDVTRSRARHDIEKGVRPHRAPTIRGVQTRVGLNGHST